LAAASAGERSGLGSAAAGTSDGRRSLAVAASARQALSGGGKRWLR
jgi:hypothetical protein